MVAPRRRTTVHIDRMKCASCCNFSEINNSNELSATYAEINLAGECESGMNETRRINVITGENNAK